MKNIAIILSFLLAIAGSSCTKMNDLHQQYLDEGEMVYASKLDSAYTYPGNNRVKLRLFVPPTRVEQIEIKWGTNNSVKVIKSQTSNGVADVIIPDLEEGDQFFTIICYDKFGNASLPMEVNVMVYGAYYQSQLRNVSVTSCTYKASALTVKWGNAPSQSTGVQLEYTNTADVATVVWKPIPAQTNISDYKAGTTIKYSTIFKPVSACIDSFMVDYKIVTPTGN